MEGRFISAADGPNDGAELAAKLPNDGKNFGPLEAKYRNERILCQIDCIIKKYFHIW